MNFNHFKRSALFSALFGMLAATHMHMAEGTVSADPFDEMDDLLDKSIDDLADLPSFKVPDTGIYRLDVTAGAKFINEKPAIEINFVVKEVVELEDSTITEDQQAKAGDKFSVAFFLKDKDGNKSELGEGRMKEFAAPFSAHFAESNVKKIFKEVLANPVAITAKIVKKARKNAEVGVFDARVSDVTID